MRDSLIRENFSSSSSSAAPPTFIKLCELRRCECPQQLDLLFRANRKHVCPFIGACGFPQQVGSLRRIRMSDHTVALGKRCASAALRFARNESTQSIDARI